MRPSRLLLLSILATLSACQRDNRRIIGVIPKGQAHLFWQSVHGGAVKAAREANVQVVWNGPPTEVDSSTQIQIVESMVNRHVSAIVLAPIDKKALVNVVERAGREGVPVVVFDSGLDTQQIVSQVATDNYRAGQMAAQRMGTLLGGKGKVAVVAVQPGAASTMARESGFEETIAKEYPAIKIVQKQYGMADFAKSLAVSEDMLNATPDLAGLFASNESSTVGAARALKARGGKVKLVGFDWSPNLKEGLESGVIDSLIVQDPFRMGYESVRTALRKLAGETVPKVQNLEPLLVQRADLAKPDVQSRLNPDLKPYLD